VSKLVERLIVDSKVDQDARKYRRLYQKKNPPLLLCERTKRMSKGLQALIVGELSRCLAASSDHGEVR